MRGRALKQDQSEWSRIYANDCAKTSTRYFGVIPWHRLEKRQSPSSSSSKGCTAEAAACRSVSPL